MKIMMPKSLTRTVARSLLKAKKSSPTIFFATGVVGVVGSAVLASKATLRLDETLDKIESRISDSTDPKYVDLMPQERKVEYYKDVAWVYSLNAVDICKLYGPAIIVGGFLLPL